MVDVAYLESLSIGRVLRLGRESERALTEAAGELSKPARFPDESWVEELETSGTLPWNRPRPIFEQMKMLNYRIDELEFLLREKEERLRELAQVADATEEGRHRKVKRFSVVGTILFCFSIIFYLMTNIIIVNPLFALFAIIGCGMFWLMARVDESSQTVGK
jgi:hypothetical protein